MGNRMLMIIILSLMSLGFAVLTITADYRGKWPLGYVARPAGDAPHHCHRLECEIGIRTAV